MKRQKVTDGTLRSKVCSTCKCKKAIDCFFKRGDDPKRFRSQCKECHAKTNYKSTKAYYKRHAERINKNKYAKYKNRMDSDQDFKRAELAKAMGYYYKKPKPLCKNCNTNTPSYRRAYCDACIPIMAKTHQVNSQKRLGKEHINKIQNIRVKRKVADLTDGYIAGQIRGNKFPGWKIEEIPNDLIELKRNIIKLKREIKDINNGKN